jgi:hypothetical protein
MTSSNDAVFILIPYLQFWDKDASTLNLSLLITPRGSPLDAPKPGVPAFADCKFVFDVHLQDATIIPTLPSGTAFTTVSLGVPANARKIFASLASLYPIDPAPKRATRDSTNKVMKYAPPTYQIASGSTTTGSDLVSTEKHSYFCALKLGNTNYTYQPLPKPNPLVSWGKVIAILLRNPSLARAAGMIRDVSIPIPNPTIVKKGGFVYLTLSSTSDGSSLVGDPTGLQVYATRFPNLVETRKLFTPLVFPVMSQPPSADFGPLFAEVQQYDDGWAKIVHCWQEQVMDPSAEVADGSRPVRDQGIKLGWDDKQITVWMDRQLADTGGFNSPIGIQGYRIDVKAPSDATWTSLTVATGPLSVPGVSLGVFSGELAVEIYPAQLEAQLTGQFWLPMYFSQWFGTSLVSLDPNRLKINGVQDPSPSPPVQGVQPSLPLAYGNDYQFRVRLMDHTGGGPSLGDEPINPSINPVGNWSFRRWIRPLRPKLVDTLPGTPDPSKPPTSITIQRPLMRCPAVIFTAAYSNPIQMLLDDIQNAQAQNREAGLPDPDVDRIQIIIEVAGLPQDPGLDDPPFSSVYTTTRPFPNDFTADLTLDLAWKDIKDVSTLDHPSTGPLSLPTGRLVNLRIAALCKDDSDLKYFGADDVRLGPEKKFQIRKFSSSETSFFLPVITGQSLVALYLQPDPPIHPSTLLAQNASGNANQTPQDIGTRFATVLDLRNDGLAIRAQIGRRVIFACSSALHYVIGPDRASITFASQTDLALKWLVAIRLTIDRDWSWDSLAGTGITISRDDQVIESFSPGRNVNQDALLRPQRGQTDIIVLDAIDPKPPAGSFPTVLNLSYTIQTAFQGGAQGDAPISMTIELPVTTPPSQVPQVVSAGIAMSPYQRASDYSSTVSRDKALWIELAQAVENPQDTFFARVLFNAPDPLYALNAARSQNPNDTPLDPILPVDPEWVRTIVPGEADDLAGLSAMQKLIPSDSPLHWALPLPPGISAASPELFGFYTYELRVGHATAWSTAQGRFGPPLRVTGLQHPPPQLICSAKRNTTGISVSAPFATPVRDKVSVSSGLPRTKLVILLYAQAVQIDGTDSRNVLIMSQAANADERRIALGSNAKFGDCELPFSVIMPQLTALGFGPKAPLSVLAVELLPQGGFVQEPLQADLGNQRILRTSSLIPVPQMCG